MKINVQRLEKDISKLSKITSTPGDGVTRSSWSKEDALAKVYLKQEMEACGLTVFEDGIGTLFGRREGSDPSLPVVMVGSHYDSVVNGGRFDGVVGTVAALEVMRTLNENKYLNKFPIEMIAMNAEEGETYGPSTGVTNSRAMVGTLTYDELNTVKDRFGKTKTESMLEYGITPNLEVSVREKGSIKNFVELHIEQGTVLEANNIEIGLVEYLPGIGRYKVIFKGEKGDSTIKLSERKDALLAASYFSIEVNKILSTLGDGITGGVNQMDILPNSNQFVADEVEVKVEVRTFTTEYLEKIDLSSALQNILKKISQECGVSTEFIEMRRVGYDNPTPPSEMSLENVELMKEICEDNQYSYMILNNGTGHDAMIMTDFTATNMIYIPSKGGKTHEPEEYSYMEDIEKGTQVVLELVKKLSQ